MKSRSLLPNLGVVILTIALCLGFTGWADAQEKFPNKEIAMICASPAGTSTDLCAEALATAASKILSQNIIFLNKPGAAHSIALVAVKLRSPMGIP